MLVPGTVEPMLNVMVKSLPEEARAAAAALDAGAVPRTAYPRRPVDLQA